MLKKNMFFNIIFSRFFVVLAFENAPQIEGFVSTFQKHRFSENRYKTLAVRTKIKVRIKKKQKRHQKIHSNTHSNKNIAN